MVGLDHPKIAEIDAMDDETAELAAKYLPIRELTQTTRD